MIRQGSSPGCGHRTGSSAGVGRARLLFFTGQVAALSIRIGRHESDDGSRKEQETREREQTEQSKADLRGLHAGIESSSADPLEFALGMRILMKATWSNGSEGTKIIQLIQFAYGSETLRRRNWRLVRDMGAVGRTCM